MLADIQTSVLSHRAIAHLPFRVREVKHVSCYVVVKLDQCFFLHQSSLSTYFLVGIEFESVRGPRMTNCAAGWPAIIDHLFKLHSLISFM